MKRILVVLALMVVAWSTSSAHYRPHGSVRVSFGVFYSSLSPYGEWIEIDYGVYAWRPFRVPAGWRPYLYGRWVWTDYGWYWASAEPWSWAAYHYGRWYYDDFYGWIWIPGYEWAPAWVEWRYGGDYIGWAPLGPYAVFSIHFGIHYTHHWVTPVSYWSFVHCRYISAPSVHRHVYRTEHNTRYIGRTRGAGSVRYDNGRITSRGPERQFVERRGNVRLDRVEVIDAGETRGERLVRTEGRERIEVYRPVIEDRQTGSSVERPEGVRRADRPIDLDTRRIDVRAREESPRQGDIRSRERDRSPGETVRPERRSEPERRQMEERPARRPQRESATEPRNTEGRSTEMRRQEERKTQPDRQIERKQESEERPAIRREERPSRDPQPSRESTRSRNPERTVKREEGSREERRSDSNPRPERRR